MIFGAFAPCVAVEFTALMTKYDEHRAGVDENGVIIGKDSDVNTKVSHDYP